MSSFPSFDMFRLAPDGMTESVVSHCGQIFFEVTNQALLRIKDDQGSSLLSQDRYLRNREYLVNTVEDVRRMLVFFDERYQNFLSTKNNKVRQVLANYPRHPLCFPPVMAAYFPYRRDYKKLKKSIFQHLDACQQKIGGWVEFNQLTYSLFRNGKAEMLSLMEELHKKHKELFGLILTYHAGRQKGELRVWEFEKRIVMIKNGYYSLVKEAKGFFVAEKKRVKTLVSASEHTKNVLYALRKRLFEQDADYSLEHLSGFSSELESLKIEVLLQTSETCQHEWTGKINAHLHSLADQNNERYCNEVQLKALELTSNLDLELIPGPGTGLSQEMTNQIDRLGDEILALTSRCSKLRREEQELQEKIVLMREKKISSFLNNSQEL